MPHTASHQPTSRRQFLTYVSAFSGIALLSACAVPMPVIQSTPTAQSGQGETDMNTQTANNESATENPSIVLVHGAFADGSGWEGIYKILTQKGYSVSVTQHPTISLADDVAITNRVIDAQGGPVLLVGHSYGGMVITEAGNNPNVVGLVYVAAFVPDKDESVATLNQNPVPDAPPLPILPPQDGFLLLDRAKFPEAFAADVDAEKAQFMAASQLPWGLEALSGTIREPAWKSKPGWFLLPTDDKIIPPVAQRSMAERAGMSVVEIAGSHAIYVSRPDAVATLIEEAVEAVKAAA